MKKSKVIIPVIIVIIIACGAVFGYNYWFDSVHYLTTNNASVSADTITITPLASGKISTWEVNVGDEVTKDEVLGTQDIITTMSDQGGDTLHYDIKTPIDGKIVQSNILVGQTVAPGIQAAIVADTKNMYIKANIQETDIFKLTQEQNVDVCIDAYPDMVFKGSITQIGLATQSAFSSMASLNTSGTYTKVIQLIPVKISIENPENLPLLMGMNATVKITIQE